MFASLNTVCLLPYRVVVKKQQAEDVMWSSIECYCYYYATTRENGSNSEGRRTAHQRNICSPSTEDETDGGHKIKLHIHYGRMCVSKGSARCSIWDYLTLQTSPSLVPLMDCSYYFPDRLHRGKQWQLLPGLVGRPRNGCCTSAPNALCFELCPASNVRVVCGEDVIFQVNVTSSIYKCFFIGCKQRFLKLNKVIF